MTLVATSTVPATVDPVAPLVLLTDVDEDPVALAQFRALTAYLRSRTPLPLLPVVAPGPLTANAADRHLTDLLDSRLPRPATARAVVVSLLATSGVPDAGPGTSARWRWAPSGAGSAASSALVAAQVSHVLPGRTVTDPATVAYLRVGPAPDASTGAALRRWAAGTVLARSPWHDRADVGPAVTVGLDRLLSTGVRQVVVVPGTVFSGAAMDDVVAAAARWAAMHATVHVRCAPPAVAAPAALADLLLERYAAALDAAPAPGDVRTSRVGGTGRA